MEFAVTTATGIVVSVLSKTLSELCVKGINKITTFLKQDSVNSNEPVMIPEEMAEALKAKHGIVDSISKTK